MELSKEYLVENGFATNHPEYVLSRFYKSNNSTPEWRVNVEMQYIPMSNVLAYNIDCWRCNDQGAICKRASVHMATTVEELDNVMKLCGIND